MTQEPDDSEVYVIFDPLNNRTSQLICGPYPSVIVGNGEVRAWDAAETNFVTVGVQEEGGWRAHPSIRKRSPFYAAICIRSTMQPGHPAREGK